MDDLGCGVFCPTFCPYSKTPQEEETRRIHKDIENTLAQYKKTYQSQIRLLLLGKSLYTSAVHLYLDRDEKIINKKYQRKEKFIIKSTCRSRLSGFRYLLVYLCLISYP